MNKQIDKHWVEGGKPRFHRLVHCGNCPYSWEPFESQELTDVNDPLSPFEISFDIDDYHEMTRKYDR